MKHILNEKLSNTNKFTKLIIKAIHFHNIGFTIKLNLDEHYKNICKWWEILLIINLVFYLDGNLIMLNDTHREKLNSIQEFAKIEYWLLQIFLISLHNQLGFIYSTVTWCLNKVIHQITRNRKLASLQQFYIKLWFGFWLNTETDF